jgi:predicted  nucleic acid-binding Zn-ribbon protein
MKNINNYLIFSFLAFLLATACSSEKEVAYKAAAKTHNEAAAIHDSLAGLEDKIEGIQKQLLAKKETLTDSLAKVEIDEVLMVLGKSGADLEAWEEDMVEVPGNEHEHKHADGEKHHEHKTTTDVTPEQLTEIQNEMNANIKHIRQNIKENIAKADQILKKK